MVPSLFVLTHELSIAKHVGEKLGNTIVTILTIRVGTEEGFCITGKKGVSGVHIAPIEIKACIPVPRRTEGVFAALVAEEINAARSCQFHIVEVFLQLVHGDVGRNVHEGIDQGIVLRLDGVFQLGEVCLDLLELSTGHVLGVFHCHRHVIDTGVEIVA